MYKYSDKSKSRNPYFEEEARTQIDDPSQRRNHLISEKQSLLKSQRETEEKIYYLQEEHKIVEYFGKSPDSIIHYPAVHTPRQGIPHDEPHYSLLEQTAPNLYKNEVIKEAHDEIVRPGIRWHYYMCKKCGNETFYNAEWGGKLEICPNIIEIAEKLHLKSLKYNEEMKNIYIPPEISHSPNNKRDEMHPSFFHESHILGHQEDFSAFESRSPLGKEGEVAVHEGSPEHTRVEGENDFNVSHNEMGGVPEEVKEEEKKEVKVTKKKSGCCIIF